jgi:ubiquinol-cytochrome c reductase core subunit 2
MLSRSILRGRSSARACVRSAQHRGYAGRPCLRCRQSLTQSAAAGSANFETSEAAGIKLVSRHLPGPTASLALVAKAGTRYEWVPGLAEALEKFAFRVCRPPQKMPLTK